MAQNTIGRLFRGQGSSTLRRSIGSFTQKRSISKHAIPIFSPTSSPELDDALNNLREELFIPYGLGITQRRMMFKQKYTQVLDEEPIAVPIGPEEDFILRPMNPQTRPTKKEIVDVLARLQTSKDWQNLVPFLTGLHNSGRVLNPNRVEWLVRRAGQADALGVILESAKQVERTNFTLKNVGVVQRLFFELHLKAQRAEFKGPELSKALSLAKQFVALMEAPAHFVHDVELDPKRKPFLIGTLLELSAAQALNEFDGVDQNGDVATYSRRLIGSWGHGDFKGNDKKLADADLLLQELVPIYNGMKLAAQVKGIATDKALSHTMKTRMNTVSMTIKKKKELLSEKNQERPSVGLEQSQLLH